MLNDVAEEEER